MSNALDHRRGTPDKINAQLDYILLDGSGSMMGEKWWDSLDAIQSYIDGVKAGNVKSQTMLHLFEGSNVDVIARDCPIDQWKSLREESIDSDWGSTPLYDAIVLMGARLRDLDPPRASIVIVTDGDEAGSKFATLDQARSILDWMRAKGWQVTFIGADFDNRNSAGLLGADQNSAIGVSQKRLSDATSALAKKRARYALYGTPMHWSEDEQQNFGGFLSGPSK
jgi:hypothetical protein